MLSSLHATHQTKQSFKYSPERNFDQGEAVGFFFSSFGRPKSTMELILAENIEE
jgi:hypothetical protein